MPTTFHFISQVSLAAILALQSVFGAITHPDTVPTNWKEEIPRPVYPDKDFVDLYETAWEIASGNVRKGPEGLPSSPYMDENCYDSSIWIWDTCFMSLFTKYAPKSFPGIESLDNFYWPMIDEKVKSPLLIHIPDNPPLFAWAEHDNFIMSGNRKRLGGLLIKDYQILLNMYVLFNKSEPGTKIRGCTDKVVHGSIGKSNGFHHSLIKGQIGFTWTGRASGMDNTPRGRDSGGYDKILWVDAISQQALSARCLSELHKMYGDENFAWFWKMEFDYRKKMINHFYWDDQDGFYYDVDIKTRKPCRVKTIASLWPLMAGVASPQQARRIVAHLLNPKEFGGEFPCPSLSRDDKEYNNKTGDYWKGGIWLPTTYMTVKALELYGYKRLADEISLKTVTQMLNTYKEVEPHTIWECYSPSGNLPSTEHGHRVRPDFCGWSALGPISLFIENILGFRQANAHTQTVQWRLNPEIGKHGLLKLKFGTTTTDILYDGEETVLVAANAPYTLAINGRRFDVPKGKTKIPLADIPEREPSN